MEIHILARAYKSVYILAYFSLIKGHNNGTTDEE